MSLLSRDDVFLSQNSLSQLLHKLILLYTVSILMSSIENESSKSHQNEISHTHHEHDGDDNCDGCQKQRHQNNMLVNFYERLNSIEGKVTTMKESISSKSNMGKLNSSRIQQMDNLLSKKPQAKLNAIKEHNSKDMGYELATQLIERQLRTRLENQRLQKIIDELQKQKERNEEKQKIRYTDRTPTNPRKTKSKDAFIETKSQYSDALDEVRMTKQDSSFLKSKRDLNDSYFKDQQNKRYWGEASQTQEQTNFSNFTGPKVKSKASQFEKSKYEGLNLWLYQYKPQQIDDNPIKSLRRPPVMSVDKRKNRVNKF